MNSEALCLSCGMCCNGAMFGHVVLLDADLPALDAHGTPTLAGDSGPVLPQPCPYLSERRCTIYADRFRSCRDFDCVTLQAAQRGEIDMPEAQRRIALANAALDAVLSAMPAGEGLPDARRRRERLGKNGSIAPPDARIAMLLTALDRILDRYFRFPGDRVIDRVGSGPG